MSEFDSLSDSDWLEVMSSGHESDGAFSHESDHDDLSSRGLSRRSSFSNAAGEVDAWEGMLSDVGTDAEADTAASGTYPSSLPLVAQSAQPFAGPHGDDDDERVREALDQSFVGTLSGSRTMATSAVSSATSSTHSVHDLKLSFPDPLSSPRDELNRSYEAILPEDTKLPLIPESDSEQQPHDPGQTLPTPVVQAHSAELEIYLYGSSHPLKWTFVQDLVHKAASFAGYRLTNGLLTDDEAYSQALYFAKENDSHLDFFDLVTVHDKTNGKDKFELVCYLWSVLNTRLFSNRTRLTAPVALPWPLSIFRPRDYPFFHGTRPTSPSLFLRMRNPRTPCFCRLRRTTGNSLPFHATK